MMSTKDQLFLNPKSKEKPFAFSDDVAHVFDDMIQRSVPGYDQIQDLISALVAQHPSRTLDIADLGCSTGETIRHLHKIRSKKFRFLGIDYSDPMLDKAREKCALIPDVEFEKRNLNTHRLKGNFDVVILNLTLQFIQKENRLPLIKSLYSALKSKGRLILIEKVSIPFSDLDHIYTSLYYDYKRSKGYSINEIEHKREALSDVLHPLTSDENRSLLEQAGFCQHDVFYRWINFEGRVAVK